MKLNKKVSLLTTTLSALLFSMSSYGATELGTFCFAGQIQQLTGVDAKTGSNTYGAVPCVFKFDLIQHITSYDLSGVVTCNNGFAYSNSLSGNNLANLSPSPSNVPLGGVLTANSYTLRTTGNGFISGNSFVGSLNTYFITNYDDIYPINVNLSTMVMTVGYQNPMRLDNPNSSNPQPRYSVATFNNAPCQ